jgi:hypothetical protein
MRWNALVNLIVTVGPQPHLQVGVHPRVHGRGHQHGAASPEHPIDPFDLPLKQRQAEPAPQRVGRLQLDHVQHQFIRPADIARLEVGHVVARRANSS